MDVVYVFKESSEDDSIELRYSLRSLRNLPHDKVYVVGEKPAWLSSAAVHIAVPQTDTKYRNVTKNLLVAINTPEISDDFIFMNDDFFIMKPFAAAPTLHWGPIRGIIGRFAERYDEESNYMRRMKQLYRHLRDQGSPEPLSYELHVPMVFTKDKLKQLFAPEFGPIYQLRSIYGNHFQVGGSEYEDCKVYLDQRHNTAAYRDDPANYLRAQDLLSATGAAFRSDLVGDHVRSVFSDTSVYEL